jgi:hypothetical protein
MSVQALRAQNRSFLKTGFLDQMNLSVLLSKFIFSMVIQLRPTNEKMKVCAMSLHQFLARLMGL